jgi:signal transduction histidine kinase
MPVRRTVTDLSTLADAVLAAVRILQPTRDIAVETVGNSSCRCDPELTRRIIENLVGNAMKHTPTAARIRVVISGSKERAHISVHDDGPGVPPTRRSRIFEPFNAEGLVSANGVESSGIGLAFCKLAAEAQGGSIRLVDGVSGGSVFLVDLPR